MNPQPEPVLRDGEVVVAQSNGAVLVRTASGSLSCKCPFACMAASEPCEFAGKHDH